MRPVLISLLVAPLLFVAAGTLAEPEGTAEKLRRVEELMRLLKEADGAGGDPRISFAAEGDKILRAYNVADLVLRITDYRAPNLRLRPAGAEVDEARPLFGAVRDGEVFFAGVDEIVELIGQSVSPGAFEEVGASISASGRQAIVIVARAPVHDEVAAFLARLRDSILRLVTVEVRVLRRGAGVALAPVLTREEGLGVLERAESGDGLSIVRSVRVTGLNGQRVAVFDGMRRPFVQDYSVAVAESASVADPIVGLVQTGLALTVRPLARGGQVVLDVEAQMAEGRDPPRVVETPAGRVEVPDETFRSVESTVTIPAGGYAFLAGGSDWGLLISAAVVPVPVSAKGGER